MSEAKANIDLDNIDVIVNAVNKILEPRGISVILEDERKQSGEKNPSTLLVLKFLTLDVAAENDPLQYLRETIGIPVSTDSGDEKDASNNDLFLCWRVPHRDGLYCTMSISDPFEPDETTTYYSTTAYRRPEFGRRAKTLDITDKDGNKNSVKATDRAVIVTDEQGNEYVTDVTPLELCPDLEAKGAFVASSWWHIAKSFWQRFADRIGRLKKQKESAELSEFVRLEAGLNAIWVSSDARADARFEKIDGDNPLLLHENKRKVRIDRKAETLGRLRIPHTSHENRLCPFQTPESKRTGLDLFLSAGANVEQDGKITPGDDMFSLAVGMVPYPHHTDGPRLMMGGKNMKQAEPDIDGREGSIVPGWYEGSQAGYLAEHEQAILATDAQHPERKDRLMIGLNALTVIMPFAGGTYEDGIVISQSLAKRFHLPASEYSTHKVFNVLLKKSDALAAYNERFPDSPLKELSELTDSHLYNYFKSYEELCERRSLVPKRVEKRSGGKYLYGDGLPWFKDLKLYEKEPRDAEGEENTQGNEPVVAAADGKKTSKRGRKKVEEVWKHVSNFKFNEIYAHHAPGTFDTAKVTVSFEPYGTKNEEKYYEVELHITWRFRVDRPMFVGDKITGRNGNKGVITRILPDEEMPQIHFADGLRAAELILSPSSVMGRMNLGQIWEMTQSVLSEKCPNVRIDKNREMNSADWPSATLLAKLKECGGVDENGESIVDEKGKPNVNERGAFHVTWRDESGEHDGYAFAGWQYYCRLHHHAWKKLQGRGANAPIEQATGQPLRCGARTGQRLGEMENWTLYNHGAFNALDEMRENYTGKSYRTHRLLETVLRALGIESSDEKDGSLTFKPLKKVDKAVEKSLQELQRIDFATEPEGTVYRVYSFSGKKDAAIDENESTESSGKNLSFKAFIERCIGVYMDYYGITQDDLNKYADKEESEENETEAQSDEAQIPEEHLKNVLDEEPKTQIVQSTPEEEQKTDDSETNKKKLCRALNSILDIAMYDEQGNLCITAELLSLYRDQLLSPLIKIEKSWIVEPGAKTEKETVPAAEGDGNNAEQKDQQDKNAKETRFYRARTVLQSFLDYRKELINLLSHKTGIPRRYLSGRRYNHSGRAVIVPAPDMHPHEVKLPVAMLVELFEGYDKRYTDFLPPALRDTHKLREIVNDMPARQNDADSIAKVFDEYLNSEQGQLWCFMIRQPSLHRHSVQAFRVRCWNAPVIGLPPLVTPGFNADFDGDTMAVFLPPYDQAKDLAQFSIINNPGLTGKGSSAFAAELDLALGWWNIANDPNKRDEWSKYLQKQICVEVSALDEKGKPYPLSDYLPRLLEALGVRSKDGVPQWDFNKKSEILLHLQQMICEASSGEATMTPVEFATLCEELAVDAKPCDLPEKRGKQERHKKNDEEPFTDEEIKMLEKMDGSSLVALDEKEKNFVAQLEKAAEKHIETLLIKKDNGEPDHADFGLSTLLRAKAKGKEKNVRQMCWGIGTVSKMVDNDLTTLDKPNPDTFKTEENIFISGNFWEGLKHEELFAYSYPSRFGMAQKKLAVAPAGYLSRQLAEGLFEVRAFKTEKQPDQGLWIEYDSDTKPLKIGFSGARERFALPKMDKKGVTKDLRRLAWGRVPLGMIRCLDNEDLIAIEQYWNGSDSKLTAKAPDLKALLDATPKHELVLRSPLFAAERKKGRMDPLDYGADVATMPYDAPVPVKEGFAAGLGAAQAIGERGTQLAMKRFHDVAGSKGADSKPSEESKTETDQKDKKENKNAELKKVDSIQNMKNILVFGRIDLDDSDAPILGLEKLPDKKKDYPELTIRHCDLLRLKRVLAAILAKEPGSVKANDELPQSLIHYEVTLAAALGAALSQRSAQDPNCATEGSIEDRARRSDDCYLSALAHENIRGLLQFFKRVRDEKGNMKRRKISSYTDDKKSLKSAMLWKAKAEEEKKQ